jgi:hypothetical protein
VIVRGNVAASVGALLASALLLGIGMMSFHDGAAATKPVVLPFDSFWCATNDDCSVVERIGCCPCSEGGAQGAVTKWHRDDLRLFLKSACRPRPVCVQLDLCRSDVKAICEDRACRLVPDPARRTAAATDYPTESRAAR